MKLKYTYLTTGMLLLAASLSSCEDFLNKEPLSNVIPEEYYLTADQIQAATVTYYDQIMPNLQGAFNDGSTDIQVGLSASSSFGTGLYKVGMDNSNYDWGLIRNLNYVIDKVETNLAANLVTGDEDILNQSLGELYFMRALRYFNMYRSFGDLPIVTKPLPANEDSLVVASKRMPRNEVARFIITELDKAHDLLVENFDPARNRVSPDVARLVKARVALFEGSWLKNFAGTAFVPNGEGWPGKTKDYNANYEYPAGDIQAESKWFYETARDAAEEVAEKYKGLLTINTGIVPQSDNDVNDYFYMFGAVDMSPYKDILMWREFSKGKEVTCNTEVGVQFGNWGTGVTRAGVESFVMKDGLPRYASHDGFTYDDSEIATVRANADPRLHIFLKEPGQANLFKNMDSPTTHGVPVEPYPDITNTDSQKGYSTGYTLRKGGTFDKALAENFYAYNGAISFRATEALLIYMEAAYELTKDLNAGHILEYWKAVRTAAGFTGDAIDPQGMIAATDMNHDKDNWVSYTAGHQLTDKVEFNIRRERCSELFGEGLRGMDLARWRSYDQLMTAPCHVEGFHLWNTPMESWYEGLIADGSVSANVSSRNLSEYLRPFEKNMTSSNLYKDGLTWHMAHYLNPMPIRQLILTSSDHTNPENSPLYQNPYWGLTPDTPAEQ